MNLDRPHLQSGDFYALEFLEIRKYVFLTIQQSIGNIPYQLFFVYEF